MTIPSTSPVFATQATFTVDGDSWGGDPTRVDPGASRRTEGFEPDTLPAEWLNFMIGNHGDWLAWFRDQIGGAAGTAEWVYGDGVRSRTKVLPLTDAREVYTGGAGSWTYQGGASGLATVGNPLQRKALIPLRLPNGAKITILNVRVSPGAVRATVADRVHVGVIKVNNNGLTSTTIAGSTYFGGGGQDGATGLIVDDGTATGNQALIISGMTEIVDNTTAAYFLQVTAGNTNGSDSLVWASISFDDPGPRNN